MTIELTEQLVTSMAPQDKAVLDGRGLIRKGAFRQLAKSADGTLVFADCQGSGSTPYKVSIDLATGGDRPTTRCNCPSRQHPCKHALGLMLAFVAKGADFKVADPPADLLEKRTKLVEKNTKVASPEAATKTEAKPRTVNKAALAKKAEQQTEALDQLEKFVLDLVGAGLGGVDAKGLRAIDDQAKRMADADLQGARALLLRLAAVVAAKAHGTKSDDDEPEERAGLDGLSDGEKEARLAGLVTQLWVTIRKGRKALEGRQDEGESKTAADAQVESLLGRRWQLPELKEQGYWTTDRVLFELADERTDDAVMDMAVTQGWLLDLADGTIHVERTALPVGALNAGARLRVSRPGVLQVKEAAVYPGDELNRRIRWDEKNVDVAHERARTADDFAKVASLAKPVEPVMKSFREQMKNPLAAQEAVVLLAAARFAKVGDALVMDDAAGARVVFRDPRGAHYPTTANLAHAAGAFGPGALAARLWFDPLERVVYAQALALVTADEHVRLGM